MYFLVVTQAETGAQAPHPRPFVFGLESQPDTSIFARRYDHSLLPDFKQGDRVYSDSGAVCRELPSRLRDVSVLAIQTAKADTHSRSPCVLRFWAEQNTRVFICLDSRAAVAPSWLLRLCTKTSKRVVVQLPSNSSGTGTSTSAAEDVDVNFDVYTMLLDDADALEVCLSSRLTLHRVGCPMPLHLCTLSACPLARLAPLISTLSTLFHSFCSLSGH
jgi:hypothetical protein